MLKLAYFTSRLNLQTSRAVTRDFLGFRMQTFLGIVLYMNPNIRRNFKSALVHF